MKRSFKRNLEYRFKQIFGGEYFIPWKDVKQECPGDPHIPEGEDLTIVFMGNIKLYYYTYRYRINKWMRIKSIDIKLFLLKITQKIISKI